jgi:hypothetical protein
VCWRTQDVKIRVGDNLLGLREGSYGLQASGYNTDHAAHGGAGVGAATSGGLGNAAPSPRLFQASCRSDSILALV